MHLMTNGDQYVPRMEGILDVNFSTVKYEEIKYRRTSPSFPYRLQRWPTMAYNDSRCCKYPLNDTDVRQLVFGGEMEEIIELYSTKWPSIGVLVCQGDYFITKHVGRGDAVEWKDRLLTGINRELIEAATNLIPENKAYWKAFFALNLFAHLLADNPGYGERKLWRSRNQSIKDLERLRFRVRRDFVVGRSDSPKIAITQEAIEDPSLNSIERHGWGYLFNLPLPETVDTEDPWMHLFTTRVIEYWTANSEIALSETITKLCKKDFRVLPWPRDVVVPNRPPDPSEIYHRWLAYSLRFSAEHIGNTAITIVEDCTGAPLPDSSRQILQNRYGGNAIAGGTSLAFAFQLLRVDAVSDGAHLLLGSLSSETNSNVVLQRLQSVLLEYAVKGLDQFELEAAKRRQSSLSRSLDEMIDSGQEPEAPEQEERSELIDKLKGKFSTNDMLILRGLSDGLKPREIAAKYPNLSMTGKQISDRVRKLKARLKKTSDG